MFIDDYTAQQIGFNRITTWLDPLCPYGKRALSRLKPLGHLRQMEQAWQLVDKLRRMLAEETGQAGKLETLLHGVREVHGIALRSQAGFTLEDYDLFLLKEWLFLIQELKVIFEALGTPRLKLFDLSPLLKELSHGQEGSGFYLADAYCQRLASLRGQQRQGQAQLASLRQDQLARIAQEAGRPFNFQGVMRVSKLENELLARLSARQDLILAAETYTDIEFRLRDTPEMMSLAGLGLKLEDEISNAEAQVRSNLSQVVAGSCREVCANCRRLGIVDLALAKGRLARRIGGSVPQLTQDNLMDFEGLVHPLVSRDLAQEGLDFQAHTLCLGSPLVTIITGANMGGKSVALQAVGLAAAMAQHGLLPAAEKMRFSPREFIYYSRHQESGDGLSAFGTEIHSLAQALPGKDQRGLYLLDEPGRSTNPQEGSALVRAIINWLTQGRSITVLATHFPEVTRAEGCSHLKVKGLGDLPPDSLINQAQAGPHELRRLMDYSLVPVRGELPREAMRVAAYLGLNPEIIADALEILKNQQGG